MCAKLPCAPNNLSYSMIVIMQNSQEKANLQKMKSDTKIRKVRADRHNLRTGKELMKAIGPVV